jgi:hypothetical protein
MQHSAGSSARDPAGTEEHLKMCRMRQVRRKRQMRRLRHTDKLVSAGQN